MQRFLFAILSQKAASVLAMFVLALGVLLGGAAMHADWAVTGLIALSVALAWLVLHVTAQQRGVRAAATLEEMLRAQSAARVQDATPNHVSQEQEMKRQFDESLDLLRRSRMGRGALSAMPWYLLIGPAASGKSTLLRQSGLSFPYMTKNRAALRGLGGTRNCDWWFSDRAVLLDTAGRYMNEAQDHGEWMGLLKLLRRARKHQPINGAVVTLDLRQVLEWSDVELQRQATEIRDRLDELTRELQAIFPVYLVLTKCDQLRGFVDTFDTLNKDQRRQVWGFTLPFERPKGFSVDAEFQRHFQDLLSALSARRVDLLAADLLRKKRAQVYAFPLQFSAAKDRVAALLALLQQDNPYQEGALLRGVYFTSGTQEGTMIDRILKAERPADLQSDVPEAARKCYFVDDLFEKVVFDDAGLAQPTERSKRTQRLLRIGGRVAAGFALLGVLVVSWLGYSSHTDVFGETRKALGLDGPGTSHRKLTAADVVGWGSVFRNLGDDAWRRVLDRGQIPRGMQRALEQYSKMLVSCLEEQARARLNANPEHGQATYDLEKLSEADLNNRISILESALRDIESVARGYQAIKDHQDTQDGRLFWEDAIGTVFPPGSADKAAAVNASWAWYFGEKSDRFVKCRLELSAINADQVQVTVSATRNRYQGELRRRASLRVSEDDVARKAALATWEGDPRLGFEDAFVFGIDQDPDSYAIAKVLNVVALPQDRVAEVVIRRSAVALASTQNKEDLGHFFKLVKDQSAAAMARGFSGKLAEQVAAENGKKWSEIVSRKRSNVLSAAYNEQRRAWGGAITDIAGIVADQRDLGVDALLLVDEFARQWGAFQQQWDRQRKALSLDEGEEVPGATAKDTGGSAPDQTSRLAALRAAVAQIQGIGQDDRLAHDLGRTIHLVHMVADAANRLRNADQQVASFVGCADDSIAQRLDGLDKAARAALCRSAICRARGQNDGILGGLRREWETLQQRFPFAEDGVASVEPADLMRMLSATREIGNVLRESRVAEIQLTGDAVAWVNSLGQLEGRISVKGDKGERVLRVEVEARAVVEDATVRMSGHVNGDTRLDRRIDTDTRAGFWTPWNLEMEDHLTLEVVKKDGRNQSRPYSLFDVVDARRNKALNPELIRKDTTNLDGKGYLGGTFALLRLFRAGNFAAAEPRQVGDRWELSSGIRAVATQGDYLFTLRVKTDENGKFVFMDLPGTKFDCPRNLWVH